MRTFYFTAITLVLLLIGGCKKDSLSSPSISLKVDGKSFLVHLAKSRLSVVDAGGRSESLLVISNTDSTSVFYLRWITAAGPASGRHVAVSPLMFPGGNLVSCDFISPAQATPGPCAGRREYRTDTCFLGGTAPASFTLVIDAVDTQSRTITGHFDGILCFGSCDSKKITDGRFRLPY